MYSYIKGTITEIFSSSITIEASSIGYLVRVANPYSFNMNEEITLYIHQIVKENDIELIGFQKKEEKELFIRLTSVKGLGPKGALAIIASSTTDEVDNAILNDDESFFTAFPGIGVKLSKQIILDLKGRIKSTQNKSNKIIDDRLEQVILALKSLGYTTQEIKAITPNLTLDNNTTTNELLKQSLKLLKK